jgi:hypothetical protein
MADTVRSVIRVVCSYVAKASRVKRSQGAVSSAALSTVGWISNVPPQLRARQGIVKVRCARLWRKSTCVGIDGVYALRVDMDLPTQCLFVSVESQIDTPPDSRTYPSRVTLV